MLEAGACSVKVPATACPCCSPAGERLKWSSRPVQPVAVMVEHIIGAPYDVFKWGPPKPPCDEARLKVRCRVACCRTPGSGGGSSSSRAAAGTLLGVDGTKAAAA